MSSTFQGKSPCELHMTEATKVKKKCQRLNCPTIGVNFSSTHMTCELDFFILREACDQSSSFKKEK